ncbi:MAG: hypothetical protein OEW29_02175 [Acidimicrobiia bacterium]|nr:hypothetical protein [Acidimicrobiia bacterium]
MNTTTNPQTDAVSDRQAAAVPTMRAVVQDRYGAVEMWHLLDVQQPAIQASEVLNHVHAAGLDRGTWHEMTGRPARSGLGAHMTGVCSASNADLVRSR